MQLAVCSLLRNEATRWLPSVLKAWSSFASVIVALDDGSTDGTKELLASNPNVLLRHRYAEQPAWGNESPARQHLWEIAVTESGCDWLFFLDGDMVPASDPRSLFDAPVDAIAFRLYDMWGLNPPCYRDDAYWCGHKHPRVWAVKNPKTLAGDAWNGRGIHCGHIPTNLFPERVLVAPQEMSLIHLAYSDHQSRLDKHAQYASKFSQMSMQEIDHAQTIVDKHYSIEALPFPIQYPLSKHGA